MDRLTKNSQGACPRRNRQHLESRAHYCLLGGGATEGAGVMTSPIALIVAIGDRGS
jgi:hypothetical protein